MPQIALHQPPQGYFHAGRRAPALVDAVLELRESVGEFEKPKFFDYQQKICAHSRNEQIGCTACIDVCSAAAIRSDASIKGRAGGGGIVVEPHLCVGCGACTHGLPERRADATPRRGPTSSGARIRTLLATYARAGGTRRGAADPQPGRRRAARSTRSAAPRAPTAALHGVPARVLPLEVWHTASVGIDLWLAAIALRRGRRSGCW